MSLIDRSPGGFILAANVFVFGTVLAEIWMLTTASLLAMGAMMALIIVLSGALCRFIMGLMGSEEYIVGHEAAVATVTATQVAAPTPERRRMATPAGSPLLS